MRHPPILMRVRIRGEGGNINLWLPLFLLLPLPVLLLIILSPLILIVTLALRLTARKDRTSRLVKILLRPLCSIGSIRAAVELLCSLPGLRVDLSNHKERIYVSVI